MKYNTIVLKDDVNVVINEEFLLHKVLFQTAECFQGTCLCCDRNSLKSLVLFIRYGTLCGPLKRLIFSFYMLFQLHSSTRSIGLFCELAENVIADSLARCRMYTLVL
ncbi:unnamed protein product [Albugo candida]|uniref:Uncharacterized protein n=1 Tax=Albugo candida TaxID=65357 RepID=A0A024G8Z4_9STRA|nr:unnamed protein product [Albugo candida]|eukprot:CCI42792.1 unnamed protein product [Albugo candida]